MISNYAVSKWLKNKGRKNFLLTLLIIFTLISIYWIAGFNYNQEAQKYQELSETIKALTDVRLLNALTGESNDIKNPNYLKLKEVYNQINNANHDTRFIYILGRDQDRIFFYLDSQPNRFKNILDTSYPGDFYVGSSQYINTMFNDGEPKIAGPYSSQWGIFMSALTPIKDAAGQVKMVLGIDFAISSWAEDVGLLRITVLLILIALIVLDLLQRNEQEESIRQNKSAYAIKRFPF